MATYRSEVTDPSPPRLDEPPGFVVVVEPGDRIHFLEWGGIGAPGVLLVHGLATSGWIWAPVARRLIGVRRTVSMDLRGHGLSDAPTDDGAYDLDVLGDDVVAVAEGAGLVEPADVEARVTLVGHGFGAIVAAWAAVALGPRCGGLVLVDGGWESLAVASGMEVDEFLRGLDEPPEVMRSMGAYLADRRAFDPDTWDADQEHAARSTVVETHAGRVVSSTRPHVTEACVRAMFDYDPATTLSAISAPITALIANDDESTSRHRAVDAASDARVNASRRRIRVVSSAPTGHNLMRYRPDEVSEAILSVAIAQATP
jgi:pimeloyl-ACP methyl ester carboxylesterase